MHISSECSSVSAIPAQTDTTILLNLERAEYLKEVDYGVNVVEGMILHVSTSSLESYDIVWRTCLHDP
jgi:hypothetical protein